MSISTFREKIPHINSALLVAICFLLPAKVGPIYLLSAIMLCLWLAQAKLLERISLILRQPVNWAFIVYFVVILISILWTEDRKWGWQMVNRQIPFLLFPIFWAVAKNSDCHRRYISAFIAGIALCVMLAHYNWLQLHLFPDWPKGIVVNKSPGDTAPFVDRIMYAPILAFGAYFVGYRILFERPQALWRVAYIFLFIAILVNLMLSGGRAGMVGFFALLVTLIIQRFSQYPIKAGALACLSVIVILGSSYSGSEYFRERIDAAIVEVRDPIKNVNTSVGLRINFVKNSARMFMENPLAGVGIGDFPLEYKAINDRLTPHALTTINPHNQIMLVLSTTGIIGAISLIFLLFGTLKLRKQLPSDVRHHLIAVWVGYGVICQFESYFWRSNTALMFCVLTAVVITASNSLSTNGSQR